MKNDIVSKGLPSQIILGVLVIGLGILFLLDNLGFVEIRHAIHFWPTALIIVGLVKIFDTRTTNGFAVGALMVFAGVMMTLNYMGIIYFSWHTMWPLVLIAVGGCVIYKAVMGRNGPVMRTDGVVGSDAVIDVTAILGGFERRILTQDFRGGEVTAIMGGCALDLREASIAPGGEAVVNVFAVWGGITFKVPPDWTVVLHGTPFMGGFEEKTTKPPDGSKRLIVKGYAIMGGVEVRN